MGWLIWGPPCILSSGYQGLFSWGVKLLRHEADDLAVSCTSVKNELSYTCTPPVCLHGMFKDKRTFTFLQGC